MDYAIVYVHVCALVGKDAQSTESGGGRQTNSSTTETATNADGGATCTTDARCFRVQWVRTSRSRQHMASSIRALEPRPRSTSVPSSTQRHSRRRAKYHAANRPERVIRSMDTGLACPLPQPHVHAHDPASLHPNFTGERGARLSAGAHPNPPQNSRRALLCALFTPDLPAVSYVSSIGVTYAPNKRRGGGVQLPTDFSATLLTFLE